MGSYQCICHNGYYLSNDNHTCIGMNLNYELTIINCVDNNECDTLNGGCEQMCNNTQGSYYCSCVTGLKLGTDQHNCTGI